MDDTDIKLRIIKDHIAAILGQIDDASNNPKLKSNRDLLLKSAANLRKSADDLVWTVTRMKGR